jgi:hypothetical protein
VAQIYSAEKELRRHTAGLPDGRGHGRITQNRQYKNKSGRGKLPAMKVAVSDKTIFLLLKGILVFKGFYPAQISVHCSGS